MSTGTDALRSAHRIAYAVGLAGIILVAILICYEHAIVKPNDLSKVNLSFFYVNSVISIGLLVVIIIDVLYSVLSN